MERMAITMISDNLGLHDVSSWTVDPVPLAGRYRKIQLLHRQRKYIIKFAEYRQNGEEVPYQVSEYVAGRILKSLGYDVQEVAMAIYYDQPVCLIETFNKPLITFEGFGTSTLSGENLLYDLDILHELFPEGKYSGNFSEYVWDTFLCDAFIHNLDRHPNNWGFYKENNMYTRAPLIDCASSLYSLHAMKPDKMHDIESWILRFGKSAIHYKGERTTFQKILTSENSEQFKLSASKFKTSLATIDYSCLTHVTRYWPQYGPYIDFLHKFLERQVEWFVKNI